VVIRTGFMFSRNAILLTLFGLLPWFSSFAQNKKSIPALEDSLRILASEIRRSDKDSLKSLLNEKYLGLLKRSLDNPSTFTYPFDSLKTIGKLYSPDKTFRIYNWNLPRTNGTNKYFCLIQVKQKKNIRVIELTDVSDTLNDPEFRILTSGKWYGALYYKVLMNKVGNKTCYTLLGWDGCSVQKFQKLIEMLTFDGRGGTVFGARIFRKYNKGKNARVIFAYSSQASMTLRYDQQAIPTGKKKWNPARRAYDYETRPVWMIIFDQLGALLESQEGEAVYNVPVGESLDGFLFENSGWNYIQGINARNN